MHAQPLLFLSAVISFMLFTAGNAAAATSKTGILIFDGFLTSDATAPIEVFGAAAKPVDEVELKEVLGRNLGVDTVQPAWGRV